MWTDGRTADNSKTSPEQSAIFQLVQEINKTNCSITRKTAPPPGSHFHDDWAKNVTSRVHVIQLTGTIFQLNSFIKETNVLTKFHENWAKIKTAPPTSDHFHEDWALNHDPVSNYIIGTNHLTKFHEDWTINVASRVFMNKCGRTDGRRTKTSHKSSPEQSGELKTRAVTIG
ncbi:hypothetical protein DPMN_084594 [Dreissena polymorpha]|uniref:Uncharacterized protein n=1 Tax=Dreissena polymorpha TaxID=45954 RepID=A0A9D3YC27_DREPO|nr:hypothetical protein DPMN_084594 [Dreissena polymorpha]